MNGRTPVAWSGSRPLRSGFDLQASQALYQLASWAWVSITV